MLFSTKLEQIARKRIEEGLTLRGSRLHLGKSLKYLSSIMITNCDCSTDIRVRTATALKVMSDIDIENVWEKQEKGNENETVQMRCMLAKREHLGKLKKNNNSYSRWQHFRKILDMHIMDKMRNENIGVALYLTNPILQSFSNKEIPWSDITSKGWKYNCKHCITWSSRRNKQQRKSKNKVVKFNTVKIWDESRSNNGSCTGEKSMFNFCKCKNLHWRALVALRYGKVKCTINIKTCTDWVNTVKFLPWFAVHLAA